MFPCAIQYVLIAYFIYSNLYILIPYPYLAPQIFPLPIGNHWFSLFICVSLFFILFFYYAFFKLWLLQMPISGSYWTWKPNRHPSEFLVSHICLIQTYLSHFYFLVIIRVSQSGWYRNSCVWGFEEHCVTKSQFTGYWILWWKNLSSPQPPLPSKEQDLRSNRA